MPSLSDYLKKPVTSKKKTGEQNFLQLAASLALDLNDFDSDINYLVWYLAITMNLYMHNSSHQPLPGYGKAQKRESEHKQHYFRSEARHPHRSFCDAMSKSTNDTRATSLLPRNTAHEKLIIDYMPGLKDIDQRGFPKKDKKITPYYSVFLAASGARANNFNAYQQSLTQVITQNKEKVDEKIALKTKLKKYLKPLPNKIKKHDAKTIIACVKTLQTQFKQLQLETKSFKFKKDLHKTMMQQRSTHAKSICDKSAALKLKNLTVETAANTSCVYINIYPAFTNKIRESRNYNEGVTNTLISFFGGLLNHHAAQRDLYLSTGRRQSFGFSRATLTDVGTMRIRLSLGFEPAVYNEIVLASLKDLDLLLEKFDFRDKDDDSVKPYFLPCENSQATDKKATDKTGNYLLSAMRSEDNKWHAFSEAQHYLTEAYQTNPKDYQEAAFKKFLDEFILKREIAAAPMVPTSADKKTTAKQQPTSHADSTITFSILNNLVKYAVNRATTLKVIIENDPILNLKHSYYHSLLKLFNNCNKAIHLLKNLDQFEVTHLYAKANLLIENILEYLISLDSLEQIRNKIKDQPLNSIEELTATEKQYASTKLGLKKDNIAIYFTDSGQQAITTSLLAMNAQFFGSEDKKDSTDNTIYLFANSYFEINSFFDKTKTLITLKKETAKIAFIDLTQVDKLTVESFPKLKAVVIDTTNNPNLDNTTLKELINALSKKGIWVLLVSSTLKHEELSLDKYQSGKITILQPEKQSLNPDVIDTFKSISDCAMHPAIASYLQIVNHVFQEKTLPSVQTHSIFSKNTEKTPQIIPLKNHEIISSAAF